MKIKVQPRFALIGIIILLWAFKPQHLYVFRTLLFVPNYFLLGVNFCRLLINFANSLDPDQDRLHVGPDLGSTCLTL